MKNSSKKNKVTREQPLSPPTRAEDQDPEQNNRHVFVVTHAIEKPVFTGAELAAILPAKYANVLTGLQYVGAGASPELLIGALANAYDEIDEILDRYSEEG